MSWEGAVGLASLAFLVTALPGFPDRQANCAQFAEMIRNVPSVSFHIFFSDTPTVIVQLVS